MFNLYQVLEVSASADPAEIKSGYRRAATKHHPDKPGGDEERFRLVKLAYDVLSDPERRARYDATGQVEEPAIAGNEAGALFEVIDQLLHEELQTCLNWQRSPLQVDLVQNMIYHAEERLRDFKRQEATNEKSRAELERLISKFSGPDDKPTVMQQLLQQKLAGFDSHRGANEKGKQLLERAIEYLSSCKFSPDGAPVGPRPDQWPPATGGGVGRL